MKLSFEMLMQDIDPLVMEQVKLDIKITHN